jgi:hypothetical protein
MSLAPPTLAASAGAAFVGLTLAAGCASGIVARKEPVVELSFAAGARVPADESVGESPLVDGAAALGIMWWQARGEPGPTHHYLGIGFTVVAERFDFNRTDLGVDLLLAPPRNDRRTGFQFRIGPRLAWSTEHGGLAFATEWSDSWLGSLFAEVQYDFIGEEAAFLFGARVNLLFPVTYVRATMEPLD